MKFLIDAQLPRRMCRWFEAAGFDAIHTLDLPTSNRSADSEITEIADSSGRAVVTKDSDFVDSHLLRHLPENLLLISTGNISNDELFGLISPLIPSIVTAFGESHFIELAPTGVIIRG